jgi:hypothetical protein
MVFQFLIYSILVSGFSIRNEEDLSKFQDELSRHDILEYIRQQRPDTRWVVHLLTNVTFYVNKINEHPIGASVHLPDYFLKNPGVVALISFLYIVFWFPGSLVIY